MGSGYRCDQFWFLKDFWKHGKAAHSAHLYIHIHIRVFQKNTFSKNNTITDGGVAPSICVDWFCQHRKFGISQYHEGQILIIPSKNSCCRQTVCLQSTRHHPNSNWFASSPDFHLDRLVVEAPNLWNPRECYPSTSRHPPPRCRCLRTKRSKGLFFSTCLILAFVLTEAMWPPSSWQYSSATKIRDMNT